MAEESKPRRRRLWVVPLLAVGAGAWFVRSRRAPAPDPWLPPLPADGPAPAVGAPTIDAAAVSQASAAAPDIEAGVGKDSQADPVAPALVDAPGEQGAKPLADGSAPGPEYTIKGNAGSMLFHSPSSPYYGRTKAEVWFRTPEEATAAGFTEWKPKKRSTT